MSRINDWRKEMTIGAGATLGAANRQLSGTQSEILVVVDSNDRFIGALSERSVRRAMLAGLAEDASIIALTDPGHAISENAISYENVNVIIELADGKPTLIRSTQAEPVRDNLIVLMVGGEGTRLRPLTDHCPKPLLPVQGKPLLEITLERLRSFGYKNFCMTLGYRGDMIVNHFGDGTRFGVNIEYVHEREALGTCGALRLLQQKPTAPLLVMNGDVITGINFDKLFSFHTQSQSAATMCAYRFDVQLSYGVLTAEGDTLGSLLEKPTSSHWINAGIYVLNPDAIDLIPPGRFDMPTLFQQVKTQGGRASLYAMREQWIDIGTVEEYERANHTMDIIPELGPVALPSTLTNAVTSFAP